MKITRLVGHYPLAPFFWQGLDSQQTRLGNHVIRQGMGYQAKKRDKSETRDI